MVAHLNCDQVADLLLEQFDANRAARRFSVVAIEAPTGWGKSDAVVRFYTDLTNVENGWAYWPRTLDGGRKQLFPTDWMPDPGSRMEFFWWGLLAQIDALGPRPAALDADEQLQRLAEPLADALDEFDDRWWSRLRALWSTAGLVLPQLGSVPHLIELMLQARELHGKAKDWADTAREIRDAIAASEDRVERARLGLDEQDPIRTDRAQQAQRATVAAGQLLSRVSQLLPVVIAVEDAQLLDQQSVDLLRSVAAADESTGLIVLTIAPDRRAKTDALTAWLRDLEQDRVFTAAGTLVTRKLHHVSLTPLSESALRQIAVERVAEERGVVAEGSPVVERIAREVEGSPLLLHQLLDSPTVLDAIGTSDTVAITPEVLIAAAEDDGRAEARRRFPSEVRRGLCVAAVLGLVTEQQWLAQELEDMPGCADLDTLFVLSGWLVESDGLVGFVDTSAQRTASLHIGFELGTHVTVIRQRLAGQIRQTQQEGGWPRRPLPLRLEALQAALIDAPPEDNRTDLAIELAELQARTGQLHSRRLPVLNYLLDATLKDRLLSSASASALAAGYLDLGELDEATNVLRERIRVVTSRSAENVDELTLARHNLARVLIAKSEFNEAVDLLEQVLAARYHRTPPNVDAVRQAERDIYDCLAGLWRWDRAGAVAERRFIADQAELGDHAESTILWGARLYQAYRHIDRQWDAAWGYERLIRDARATLGPMSRLAFYLRAEWAASIQELPTPDGPQRAIEAYKDLLRDRLLALGADDLETLSSRNSLANAHHAAGRLTEAIPLYERTLAECERVLGPDHPDALTSRNSLASIYFESGRLTEAIPLYERTLIDRERVLGPDHPETLASRSDLAYGYQAAGRLGEAIPLCEQALADRERVLGPDHPDTLTSRRNLAGACLSAGQLAEAVPLFEQALADAERVLGPDHPDTLTSRTNLAFAYLSVRRLAEAVPLFEHALADCERVLGPDHPDTLVSRDLLGLAYQAAGRLAEAIPLYEQSLIGRERVLGPDHPNTVSSRNSLESAYQEAQRNANDTSDHD